MQERRSLLDVCGIVHVQHNFSTLRAAMVSMDENIVTPQLVSNIVYGNCLADFEEAKVRTTSCQPVS